MAMKKKISIGIVDFIHPSDDAINTEMHPYLGTPISDIAKYKETWNFKEHCSLKEGKQATIFKINFNLEYKKQIAINNASIGGFGKGEDGGYKLGSHSFQIVRTVLVDIVNPDDMAAEDKISFKKDPKTGLVSEETMKELYDLGIVEDLFGFYLANKDDPSALKKS